MNRPTLCFGGYGKGRNRPATRDRPTLLCYFLAEAQSQLFHDQMYDCDNVKRSRRHLPTQMHEPLFFPSSPDLGQTYKENYRT